MCVLLSGTVSFVDFVQVPLTSFVLCVAVSTIHRAAEWCTWS